MAHNSTIYSSDELSAESGGKQRLMKSDASHGFMIISVCKELATPLPRHENNCSVSGMHVNSDDTTDGRHSEIHSDHVYVSLSTLRSFENQATYVYVASRSHRLKERDVDRLFILPSKWRRERSEFVLSMPYIFVPRIESRANLTLVVEELAADKNTKN